MENDILLDGIVEYTKNGNLKWNIYEKYEFGVLYKSYINITDDKKIEFDFRVNNKRSNNTSISIGILTKDRIRHYKYLTNTDLTINRFGELNNIIQKMKKDEIHNK